MLKPIFFVILHAVCENAFVPLANGALFAVKNKKIGYNESEESY